MNYLSAILSQDQLEEILDTFDTEFLLKLDDENVQKIFLYLEKHNFTYLEDIILQYTDLFIFPFEEFTRKFEKLKEKYCANFNAYLAFHLDILEEMYSL